MQLPMRGPYDSARHGEHTTHRVYYAGTREVNCTVAKTKVCAERCKPAAAPYPVAIERMEDYLE